MSKRPDETTSRSRPAEAVQQTVLLVDDHPAIHDATRTAFKEHTEYELLHALTASQARSILESNPPNFMIVDHDLPGGCTGIDLVRWAQRCLAHRAPLAILYTHRSHDEVWLPAERAGARGFVSKQSPVSHLLEALERAGAGEVYKAPEAASDDNESCTYVFESCRLDARSGALVVDAKGKWLGPKSLRLLVYLLEARLHDQRWVSFETLTQHVWGTSATEDTENLKQLVSQLRKAMENADIIATKVGRHGASSAYLISVPVHKHISWES
jgi:DNA-binding response OmpR family regulator